MLLVPNNITRFFLLPKIPQTSRRINGVSKWTKLPSHFPFSHLFSDRAGNLLGFGGSAPSLVEADQAPLPLKACVLMFALPPIF